MAKQYDRELKDALRRPKSGKTYGAGKGGAFRRGTRQTVIFGREVKVRAVFRRTVATKAYRASAPGEAPAIRTGNELRAVRVKARGYRATVFVHRGLAGYRHLLEFGTKARVQRTSKGKTVNRNVGAVAPRPVFGPLQAKLDGELLERVNRAVDVFVAFGR
jgi:hypothetical protein